MKEEKNLTKEEKETLQELEQLSSKEVKSVEIPNGTNVHGLVHEVDGHIVKDPEA